MRQRLITHFNPIMPHGADGPCICNIGGRVYTTYTGFVKRFAKQPLPVGFYTLKIG
jgi:hypothetical protein